MEVGDRAKRRKKFFADHPWCCFCGGARRATTEDHIPSRSTFDEKHWPEGYVFPACERCNSATRMDELIVAVLARSYPDDPTTEGRERTKALIHGLGNNAPHVLKAMMPTRAQTEAFIKKRGIVLPAGVDVEQFPTIVVSDPTIKSAMDQFGTKLGCALHYKHLGRILPTTAAIWVIWRTNAQVFDGELPESLFQIFNKAASTKRGKIDLGDQFAYRYEVGIEDGDGISGFMLKFRQSFVLIVMCSEGGNVFDEAEPAGEIHSPFQWED